MRKMRTAVAKRFKITNRYTIELEANERTLDNPKP